jgi:hypothetical protein
MSLHASSDYTIISILAYFHYFEENNNKNRLMRSPCRLRVYVSTPVNFSMREPVS